MKKYILLAVITFSSVALANAQERGSGMLAFNYHMAVPSGDFRDFIDQPSFIGFTADYRYYVKDRLALGLQSGYHVFHHKLPRTTYYFDSGAATLVHWRYGHVVPILIETHYDLLGEDSKLKLSAGLGLGPYFVREEVWVGLYTVQLEQWGFGLAPEVMLRYNFTDGFGMLFSPRYQAVFGAERANLEGEKNTLSFWDFRFGLFLGL